MYMTVYGGRGGGTSEHLHRHVLAIGHSDRGEVAQMHLLSDKLLATQRERGI